ncbi:MAG TPA: Lrp/AsnC family transcriptional regulator, partial [Paenirhodobacter sp.]
DGRMPLGEIARRAGISEPTARKKLAALQDSGVLRIRAAIDPVVLGYEANAVIGIDVERQQITAVARKLTDYPFVESVSVTTGPYDLMIRACFETVRDLHDFVLVELGTVDGIKDSHSFLVMRNYKFEGLVGAPGTAINNTDDMPD